MYHFSVTILLFATCFFHTKKIAEIRGACAAKHHQIQRDQKGQTQDQQRTTIHDPQQTAASYKMVPEPNSYKWSDMGPLNKWPKLYKQVTLFCQTPQNVGLSKSNSGAMQNSIVSKPNQHCSRI